MKGSVERNGMLARSALSVKHFKLGKVKREMNENSNENNLEDSNVLKVGVLLPLSGEFQEIGESFLKAIQLALYDISNENVQRKDRYYWSTQQMLFISHIITIIRILMNHLDN